MPEPLPKQSRVAVPGGLAHGLGVFTPDVVVLIDGDGAVTWNGKQIGYVWKGTRTYSPPTHRGSRIVKYHNKQVPEWKGGEHRRAAPKEYGDTRRDVIRRLVARSMEA